MANCIISTTYFFLLIIAMRECQMLQLPVPDISSNSSAINKEVNETLQLLDEGEKVIQLSGLHRNAILLLGNTGSGKSTFVQWIAGDGNRLMSKELDADTGEFLIEADNRIGSSIWSQTIFPELVIDNTTNTGFYDNPGFSDTRSTSHDIAATYFIKKVADHVRSLKIVLIVNYPSVRQGVDRQDFMLLLRHITDLVKNVDKYKDSIGIVATKVDNAHVKSFLIPDEKVITSIAKYFETVKSALQVKLNLSDSSHEEKEFHKNAIKLLNIFLIRNNHNEYSRICIFRRPDEAGPLGKIKLLQIGKKRVQKMLHQELEFTEKSHDDFGFTLSDKSKNHVSTLVDRINDKIWFDVTELADKVQRRYENTFQAMYLKVNSFLENSAFVDADKKDAHKFEDEISIAQREISALVAQSKVPKITDLSNAIQRNKLLGFMDECKRNVENIKIQSGYFEFLQTVSSKKFMMRPLSVLFQQLETYLTVKKHQFYKDAQAISSQIYLLNEKHMENIGNSIEEYYTKKIDTTAIEKMSAELHEGAAIVSNWLSETCAKDENWKELLDQIQKSKLINASYKVLIDAHSFEKNGEYFMFLSVFNNTEFDICNSTWMLPLRKTKRRLVELHEFILFLHDLYDKLSEFEIQGNKDKYNVADLKDWGYGGQGHGIHIDTSNVNALLGKISQLHLNGYASTKGILFTEFHLRLLNLVLEKTLKSQINQNCSEPGKLIVSGDFIKFSDFVEPRGNINNVCDFEITQVDVFALKTIFIDQDICEYGLQLSIIAPKWQVIGKREIRLDGSPGPAHENQKADDGSFAGDSGKDGLAGLPGGPAGNFLGIGAQFIDGSNLTISAVGGKGGPGQAGGNGIKGKDGTPARLGFSPLKHVDSKKLILIVYNSFEDEFRVAGELGGVGGNGGNGGKAGLKGASGTIKIFSLIPNADLPTTWSYSGSPGVNGEGGAGAANGLDGNDVKASKCNKYILFVHVSEGWCNTFDIFNWHSPKIGRNGMVGTSYLGQQQPKPRTEMQSTSDTLRRYKNYLRENLRDYFKTATLFEFCKTLDSDVEIRSAYDAQALVNEFQDLAKQQISLSQNNYNQFFFESLLNRTNEYTKTLKEFDTPDSTFETLNNLSSYLQSKILK